MLEGIKSVIVLTLLILNTILDMRFMRISKLSLYMGGGLGIILFIFSRSAFEKERILALLPGILCLIISLCTKEAIGKGDGLLILVMGEYLCFSHILGICMMAFFFAGALALVFRRRWKKTGRKEIPFVPFLLIGYVFSLF